MYYDRWPKYVPVHERRAKAQKKIAKLRAKGLDVQPINIEGRKITKEFWGNSWCEHIEGFSDYESRLPRGKTYARNGSVCHLSLSKGRIKALVSGSTLYNVKINIKTLNKKKWQRLVAQCTGKLGSLLELLQGKLSDQVMKLVTHAENGLFPLEHEISFECDCPDYAFMCKHIAAVFYGIAHRIDSKPELLFELRGVDSKDFIEENSLSQVLSKNESPSGKRLNSNQLSNIFGIEVQTETPAVLLKTKSISQSNTPKEAIKPSVQKNHDFPTDKAIDQQSVAKVLDSDSPVKRVVYCLSDGHWRTVADLRASLSRRVKKGRLSRRHKVWFYKLESSDDSSFWLDYARTQHEQA